MEQLIIDSKVLFVSMIGILSTDILECTTVFTVQYSFHGKNLREGHFAGWTKIGIAPTLEKTFIPFRRKSNVSLVVDKNLSESRRLHAETTGESDMPSDLVESVRRNALVKFNADRRRVPIAFCSTAEDKGRYLS